MARVAVLLVVVAALVVPAAAVASAPATPPMVTYSENGAEPATRIRWSLRCARPAGTHPRRSAACRELARLGAGVPAPVLRTRACAEVHGGAMVALVAGTVSGRRVWVRLRRTNACEIERWNRNWFLVPAGAVR